MKMLVLILHLLSSLVLCQEKPGRGVSGRVTDIAELKALHPQSGDGATRNMAITTDGKIYTIFLMAYNSKGGTVVVTPALITTRESDKKDVDAATIVVFGQTWTANAGKALSLTELNAILNAVDRETAAVFFRFNGEEIVRAKNLLEKLYEKSGGPPIPQPKPAPR